VTESLIRAFDRHGVWLLQGWAMTETSPQPACPTRARNCAAPTTMINATGVRQ
jgi:hypothetical protein